MPTNWIDRCPEGHSSVFRLSNRSAYRCGSCELTYDGEPYDARDHDFPVDGEHPNDGEHDTEAALAAVVDICTRPERHWVKTREIDSLVYRAAAVLCELKDDGLVYHREQSRGVNDCWRPTPAGIERHRGGDDG